MMIGRLVANEQRQTHTCEGHQQEASQAMASLQTSFVCGSFGLILKDKISQHTTSFESSFKLVRSISRRYITSLVVGYPHKLVRPDHGH